MLLKNSSARFSHTAEPLTRNSIALYFKWESSRERKRDSLHCDMPITITTILITRLCLNLLILDVTSSVRFVIGRFDVCVLLFFFFRLSYQNLKCYISSWCSWILYKHKWNLCTFWTSYCSCSLIQNTNLHTVLPAANTPPRSTGRECPPHKPQHIMTTMKMWRTWLTKSFNG